MDIKEAFYKQKKELHAYKNENRHLQRELDRYIRGVAATEIFQKQLSHIQGLTLKVSEYKNVADRYQTLYEQKKRDLADLNSRFRQLTFHCQDLQWQIDCLSNKHSFDGMTAAQRAAAEIDALKDEVARLTALLNKDGTNTGTPTSKTAIDKKKVVPNSRERSERHVGAQPGHEKHFMAAFSADEITETIPHELDQCPECGGRLTEIRDIPKDELDYEIRVVKKRHVFKEYRCDQCGKVFRTGSPALKAENQYGAVLQAMALALMNLGFVSINRTRKLLSGLTADTLSISEGYLSKLQKRFSHRLAAFVEQVRKACIASDLLYWDDTVVFIHTSRACMRFYGNERIALYCAHMKKDLQGIYEDNVLPHLPPTTTVMHDHNSINYHDGFEFVNVECLQHLERDLQKVTDQSGHTWSKEMKDLLRSMIHKRKLRITDGFACFDKKEITDFLFRYDTLLEDGYKEYFKDSSRYFAPFENALQQRLQVYRQNYTAWIHDFSIPTTNNLSERSLRFVKCKDKISGQFQNEAHAQFFANIRTYIETCARHGVNEFQAILRLTQDDPYS
ncbi:MAG: transposase, partial [Lachnospiraceae bacterium]|nr:transposase [Lachnospiraceae bacterium]